jgi:hypothetical protein
MTYTVYMPKDFDDEVWRGSPSQWEPELKRRRKVGKDGCADFLVADILGTKDVELKRTGRPSVRAPEGTNFVTCLLDGEPCDQADSLGELVKRLREDMADYDWPLDLTLVFWRHHKNYERHNVKD